MRLQELRKQKKISQQELANQLSLNVMTYNNWEKEKREPNIENLCKIADYYNVSLDYLVGRKFGNDIGFLTDDQFQNLKIILTLSEKNQYKVFGYALSLLQNQN